ncbi:uncharacterized protein LOC101858371 [Aplysia californica]|uniref:Uncharacterized protein LOC101858371 n=1 Tax=Aplysia californica TaxID=6500 RepID=A0ABM0JAT5_APLCA|nr:uncharacterized protein LOC101858371 [Aplysia californica]
MACPETTSIYTRPSLPSLLTEYGFEDKSSEDVRENKVKEKEKKRVPTVKKYPRKTESFDNSEVDAEAEKQKERDEYYVQMVRDLYKLRDYYYNEYSGMLSEKVAAQRRQIRERDLIRQKLTEKKEEEERRASHHVKKRLERHTLDTTPATVSVPKTDLYHIVGLEQKLRQQGKLKTVSDYNKFREEMQDPRTFNAQFHGGKFSESHKSPGSSVYTSTSQRDPGEIFSLAPDPGLAARLEANHARSLSRISENQEASRPGTRTETWAITQQYPSMFKSRRSIGAGHGARVKPDPQADLDKRFPKLEMPKLHCFTMNLAPKPPDPEEVRQQTELRAREKQRKRMLRTVTKMYQLAMSNAATSNRIMDEHENVDLMLNGPDLCDVIADHHWMEAYGLREIPQEYSGEFVEEQEVEESPWQQPALPEGQTEPDIAALEESKGSRRSSKRGSAHSQRSLPPVEEATKSQPLALTMTEIEDTCNIKEAKTLSTLWQNYLGAGKKPVDK